MTSSPSAGLEDIRVGLVEDDRHTRDALKFLIGATPGFACVATWGSVEEALHRPPTFAPDVILLDINLPGMPGSEGVAYLKERYTTAAVLMLTVLEDDGRVFESLCHGANGYLLKRTPPARLLEHVRDAASGGAVMSPEIASRVVELFRRFTPPALPDAALTAKETALLGLLAGGHSYRSAGGELGVSINTVRNYVRSIYDKLHVHSKSEAVARALRAGLI